MTAYRDNWFQLVFNLRASVIQSIKTQVLLTMAIALIITIFYKHGYSGFSQPILAGLIPGIVLGLILG